MVGMVESLLRDGVGLRASGVRVSTVALQTNLVGVDLGASGGVLDGARVHVAIGAMRDAQVIDLGDEGLEELGSEALGIEAQEQHQLAVLLAIERAEELG